MGLPELDNSKHLFITKYSVLTSLEMTYLRRVEKKNGAQRAHQAYKSVLPSQDTDHVLFAHYLHLSGTQTIPEFTE